MTLPTRITWALLAALAGCQFEGASPAKIEMNVCSVQSECANNAECRAGMCIASKADDTLLVALQIAPRRGPKPGQEALPIVLAAFPVDGSLSRSLKLPLPTWVSAHIRDGGSPVRAEISFTPTGLAAGIPNKTITASVATGSAKSAEDFRVQLLRGVEYRMVVLPTDARRPPIRRTFVADDGTNLDVDFDQIAPVERTFWLKGASGHSLVASAFDIQSGEPVSSTASVTNERAILQFSPDAGEYRLEIRPSEAYDQGASVALSDPPCDADTPALPVFSVAAKDLEVGKAGVLEVPLPNVPQRIRWEGTVELCDPQTPEDLKVVVNLPITLHSTSLRLSPTTKVISASFDATSNATLERNVNKLRFCMMVMPGEYEILVTPPSTMKRCALFAESRPIVAPLDSINASGMLLRLPAASSLTGFLVTFEHAPLRDAEIDGIALGHTTPADEAQLTRFNRSRQATTGTDGRFELPLDLGSYDVLMKPPTGSGFPWKVRHDVVIDQSMMGFPTDFDVASPVALNGMLQYDQGEKTEDASLEGAEINAYALIGDAANDGSNRAVMIGKAAADANGRFTLLLPPSTQAGWEHLP